MKFPEKKYTDRCYDLGMSRKATKDLVLDWEGVWNEAHEAYKAELWDWAGKRKTEKPIGDYAQGGNQVLREFIALLDEPKIILYERNVPVTEGSRARALIRSPDTRKGERRASDRRMTTIFGKRNWRIEGCGSVITDDRRKKDRRANNP